jgi:hypothetical protein
MLLPPEYELRVVSVVDIDAEKEKEEEGESAGGNVDDLGVGLVSV